MNKKTKIIISLVTLIIIAISLSYFGVSVKSASKGKVILTFDDSAQGYTDDGSVKLMNQYGFRGVAFFQVDCKDWQNMAVWHDLVNRGWEIGSHSWTHAHLNNLNNAGLIHEVNESKNWIEQTFNIKVFSFAYPYCEGSKNSTVLQAIRNAGYLYARAGGGENWRGEESLKINCYAIGHGNYKSGVIDLLYLASTYDYAVALFHRVNNNLQGYDALYPSDFQYVLEKIKQSGFEVITFSDLLKPAYIDVTFQPFNMKFVYIIKTTEQMTFTAAETVSIFGKTWTFHSWSDGSILQIRTLNAGSYQIIYS